MKKCSSRIDVAESDHESEVWTDFVHTFYIYFRFGCKLSSMILEDLFIQKVYTRRCIATHLCSPYLIWGSTKKLFLLTLTTMWASFQLYNDLAQGMKCIV